MINFSLKVCRRTLKKQKRRALLTPDVPKVGFGKISGGEPHAILTLNWGMHVTAFYFSFFTGNTFPNQHKTLLLYSISCHFYPCNSPVKCQNYQHIKLYYQVTCQTQRWLWMGFAKPQFSACEAVLHDVRLQGKVGKTFRIVRISA